MFRTIAASALILGLAACATTTPRVATDYVPLLDAATRPAADKADDAARKPTEVLAFINLKGGETVLELEAGRGYYSELLAGAVGLTGKLIVQNPPEFPQYYADEERRINGRLPNATLSKARFVDLGIPTGTVDKVVWILGPHELYYTPKDTKGFGEPAKAYAEIARVLKPGGEFIAMDHAAAAGAPTSVGGTVHRIDPAVVKDMATKAGLKYVEESKILANPQDDHTKMVYDATLRRHTDQFLFRFVKAK